MNAPTRTSVNTGLIRHDRRGGDDRRPAVRLRQRRVNGTQDGLRTEFGLSDASLGFTVGSLLIGCAVGAFFAGRLADVIGRRMVMVLAALLFVVGALVQGLTGCTRSSSSRASPAGWRSARPRCSRRCTSRRWPRPTSAGG
jgi:SP family sugar:H+ symporter-like MFS transporter